MTTLLTPTVVAANLGFDYATLTALQQGAFTYLVTSASARITNETGTSFTQVTETIRIGSDGYGEFLLLKNPVVTLNSATDVDTGTVLNIAPLGTTTSGFYNLFWDGLDRIYGFYPYQIVDLGITWGWTSVPDDISYVLTEVTRRSYNNPNSYTKKRVGDVEVDYVEPVSPVPGFTLASFNDAEQSILDAYKTTEASYQLECRPDRVDFHDFSRPYWGFW